MLNKAHSKALNLPLAQTKLNIDANYVEAQLAQQLLQYQRTRV